MKILKQIDYLQVRFFGPNYSWMRISNFHFVFEGSKQSRQGLSKQNAFKEQLSSKKGFFSISVDNANVLYSICFESKVIKSERIRKREHFQALLFLISSQNPVLKVVFHINTVPWILRKEYAISQKSFFLFLLHLL